MVEAILIGAGQRGRHVYGAYAEQHPDALRFVAVAEPDPDRRETFGDIHGICDADRHADWRPIVAGRRADLAVIATPDVLHVEPAVAALDAGYDVLLEKPMAHTLAGAAAVADASRRSGANVHIAHVLRYTPLFHTVHEVIASGALGDIVTVEHRENVAAFHMAHSFVRGNWAKAAAATPMIVQKCCHDFDILTWNLPSPVRRIQSFGSLMHFRPENAPPGATDRCTDGCPAGDRCPFDARHIYLDERHTGWPVHVITDDLSRDGRLAALRTGPYGRCVYTAGSDVVDHQTVNMELESGVTATLTMHGHSHEEHRAMRYDGTLGTLRARGGRRPAIEVGDHRTGRVREVPVPAAIGGHGGGDPGLIGAVIEAVRDGRASLTDASGAFESHLLAFAAEQARLDGTIVDVRSLRAAHGGG